MSLFSRMFGTVEQGQSPGPDENEQAGDLLTQWPFVTVPIPQGENAPEHDAPAQAREAPPSEPPATTRQSVVRALQTIVVQTPAPPSPELVVAAKAEESVDIELDLDWLAVETPVPPLAAARAPDRAAGEERPAKGERRIPSLAVAPAPERTANDEGPAKAARFRELALEHAAPLRELMIALTLAPIARRCLAHVKPALASLVDAARTLGQVEAATLLTSLEAAATAKSLAATLAERERDTLLAIYAQLAQLLPETFDLKSERQQREPLLVQYLLRQVPDVHLPTIDKLRAAGCDSLEALCRCSAADLVKVGHLDGARAEAISRHVHSYHSERAERAQERATPRLRALLERLTLAHGEYVRADAAEERTRKRSARSELRAIVLQLCLLLAQIGEIELVEGLERSPVARKIEIVRRYLERPEADAPLGGRR
jgi:hypothetical protein